METLTGFVGGVGTEIDWHHIVPNAGRGAKELVDDGWIYENAQWFPRMSVYDQVKAFNSNRDKGMQQAAFDAGMSTTYMRWKKKQPHTVAIIEQVVNAIDFIKDPSMGVLQEGL